MQPAQGTTRYARPEPGRETWIDRDAKQKPGTGSRPGAVPEFQFPKCTELGGRVKQEEAPRQGIRVISGCASRCSILPGRDRRCPWASGRISGQFPPQGNRRNPAPDIFESARAPRSPHRGPGRKQRATLGGALCRQAHAHQLVFLEVELGHSAPPYMRWKRFRLRWSLTQWKAPAGVGGTGAGASIFRTARDNAL